MANKSQHNFKLAFFRFLADKAEVIIIAFGIIVLLLVSIRLLITKVDYDIIRSLFDMSYAWNPTKVNSLENAPIRHNFLPIIGVTGAILFSGLFVSLFVSFFQHQVECIREGRVAYHLKGHVVIIGFDEVVPTIVKQLVQSAKYDKAKILIFSRQDVNQIRDKVYAKLKGHDARSRVVFLHSIRNSQESLLDLHTVEAKEIFIIGDRSQTDHDSENMHLMQMLADIHRAASAPRMPISVWFEQETGFASLQLNDIKASWNAYFDFMPYNFYKDWSNRILVSSHYHRGQEIIHYPELDHKGITRTSDKHVHVVIIGMNRMGVALAKEVAHLMHFPNFDEVTHANQTMITFIDDNADTEMRFLQGRHPGYFEIAPTYYCDASTDNVSSVNFEEEMSLVRPEHVNHNFLDVRFQFIKGRIEDYKVRQWLVAQAQDDGQYLTVAVCLHDPSKALGAGLYLPEELYTTYGEDHYTNIFIRQETSSALVESLRKAATMTKGANERYAHVYPFGMLDNSVDINCWDATMAQAFNYIYDYYFAHSHLLPISLPSREELAKSWSLVSVSNQWSNIYLADSFEFKLRSIGYDINSGLPLSVSDSDTDRLAQVEHNRWCMEKLLIGYRALHQDEWDAASQMNPEDRKAYFNTMKKERFVHLCLVGNNDSKLSEAEKQLDRNIIQTLPMILEYIKG